MTSNEDRDIRIGVTVAFALIMCLGTLIFVWVMFITANDMYNKQDFAYDLAQHGWGVGSEAFNTAQALCRTQDYSSAYMLAQNAKVIYPDGDVQAYVDAVMKTCR